MPKKLLIYNEAGWELGQRNTAPLSIRDVERCSVDKVAGSGVGIYQLCLLTGNVAAMHRSRILEPYGSVLRVPYKIHMWRMAETIRSLAAQDTDVLEIVINRCRELGLEAHASLRVDDPHHTYRNPGVLGDIKYRHEYLFPDLRSPWIDAHPELWLSNGGFDFGQPDVRQRKLDVIAELLGNYDLDGLELDFTRIRPFFQDGEKEQGAALMTAWMEEIHRLVEARGHARGRPLKLTVRVEFDPEVNRNEGLDVGAWVRKELIDIICLGVIGDATPDAPADWFIDLCRGTCCLVCPSLEGFFYWRGDAIGAARTTSLQNARAAASAYYLAGADGLQLYNFCAVDQPWDRRIVDEIGDPERISLADKEYVYTMWTGAITCQTTPWESRFVLRHEAVGAALTIRIGDDIARACRLGQRPWGRLKLQIDGINRVDDLTVSLNDVPLSARPESESIFAWDSFSVDVLYFDVPAEALRQGDNVLRLTRQRRYPRFEGHIEVQACELLIRYPRRVSTSLLK